MVIAKRRTKTLSYKFPMPETPQKQNTCAIVVTYHPDPGFCERARRIAAQVGCVFIVDNASCLPARAMLEELCTQPGFQMLANAENLGIATALNQGMRFAKAQGYFFTLTFDQDTLVDENMMFSYAGLWDDIVRSNQAGGAPGLLGANFLQSVGGELGKKIKPGSIKPGMSGEWIEVPTMLTSGTLLPLATWEAIGPFRDEFFIDYVDEEFCLRARSGGFRVFLSTAPLMAHNIGEQSAYHLLWKRGQTYNYSPLRHYYRTRNAVVVWREFARREPRYVASSIKFNVKIILKVCFFESQKKKKLRGIGLGLLDGMRLNFHGPLPGSIQS